MSDTVTLIVDLDINDCSACMFGIGSEGHCCPLDTVPELSCPEVGVWKVKE